MRRRPDTEAARLARIARAEHIPLVAGERNPAAGKNLPGLDTGGAERARGGSFARHHHTMSPPALLLEGTTLALGGRVVLRALDLSIPQGLFVGVFGPNGAGKTTLLRAVLGLVRPAAGRIDVLGRPACRGQAAIGYMPQTRTPLSDISLSGRDFVAVASGGGWGLAWPDKAQRADVARVIELVDAAGYADRPMRTLSGGERQRLLLAQALLGKPKMLLLDEPLSSLDPPHQTATIAFVRELQKRLGITVLFTAHDLNPLLPALDPCAVSGQWRGRLGQRRRGGQRPHPVAALRCAHRCAAGAGPHFRDGGRPGHGAGNRMFTYDFMQNAFAAAFLVAIVSGSAGYFLVLRGQSFAGHALGHCGFRWCHRRRAGGVPRLSGG